MNIFKKIKLYFEQEIAAPPAPEEISRIRKILEASDVKINGSINFKVSYLGSVVPFWIDGQAGITTELAQIAIQKSLETIAAKLAAGQNLVEISQALTPSLDK